MKRLSIVVTALVVFAAVPALAQNPAGPAATPDQNVSRPDQKSSKVGRDSSYPKYPNLSPGELQATPEMWFYEQSMRQYQDPNVAVRRAAEFRAAQRQYRIESMKWYGLSNQRPRANADPIHSDYSPGWTSNSFYPYRWMSGGDPWLVVRPDGRN